MGRQIEGGREVKGESEDRKEDEKVRGRARGKELDEGGRGGEDGNVTRVTNEKEWLRKIGGHAGKNCGDRRKLYSHLTGLRFCEKINVLV